MTCCTPEYEIIIVEDGNIRTEWAGLDSESDRHETTFDEAKTRITSLSRDYPDVRWAIRISGQVIWKQKENGKEN
jgi:hypothetical protein